MSKTTLGSFRRFFTPILLVLIVGIGAANAQGRDVPGFGTITPTGDNWFYSQFGYLFFPDSNNEALAWSSTLNDWLQVSNGQVSGSVYGALYPGEDPGYVFSQNFGWTHFRTDGAYNGEIWSERTGWIRVVTNENGSFIWSRRLQGWGYLTADGQYFSYDYGILEPTDDFIIFNSPVFGRVTVGYPFDGWIYVENLGGLLAAQGSGGRTFWSSLRNEWLGLSDQGRLFSYATGEVLPPLVGGDEGQPADFNINEVVWLQTDLSLFEVTAELSDVQINGGQVCFTYDSGTRWRSFLGGTAYFNATPVVIAKVGDRYYASAFQWFRAGFSYRCKPIDSMWNASPSPLRNWRPSSGEKVGFLVSTPSRIGVPTRQFERTNIVWIDWP